MSRDAFFEADLATPLGLIRGRVAVDTGPMQLAELVPTAIELTNILVDRARLREEKSKRKKDYLRPKVRSVLPPDGRAQGLYSLLSPTGSSRTRRGVSPSSLNSTWASQSW